MNALVSARAGLALVIDGGRLATIHAAEPEVLVDRQPSELAFLVGEGRDFVPFENVTRDEIARQVTRAQDREDTLQLALIALDPDLAEDIRLEAVQELDELLAQEELVRYVEGVLYAKPLPSSADTRVALDLADQAGVHRASLLIERLQDHRTAIREVRRAWNAIPWARLSAEEDAWQFAAVREGLFRDLVLNRAGSKNVNGFFIEASMRPAVRSLPDHRRVLQEWIRPFAMHSKVSSQRLERQPSVVREKPRKEYGGRKRRKKPVDGRAALDRVSKQKDSIEAAMRQRNFARAQR